MNGDYISRSSALNRINNFNYPNNNQHHPRNAMKLFAVLVFTAVVAFTSATALLEAIHEGPIRANDREMIKLADVDTDGGLSTRTESSPIRHRRVTCDLLSINTPWGGFNHAACAARCIAQKHKGGACRDGVCHCRN